MLRRYVTAIETGDDAALTEFLAEDVVVTLTPDQFPLHALPIVLEPKTEHPEEES